MEATNINVAVRIDLMTLLSSIEVAPIKHICWVETNGEPVQAIVAGAKDKFAGC